jgi:phosphoribosylformylglycinamidine synthase II
MLLVADKERAVEVLDVFSKWGLDASIVGEVTEKPHMVITQSGVLVADIPNQALTDDAPLYHRPVGVWKAPVPLDPPAHVLEELKKPRDYPADLKKLLASANICDKRWVFEQYDSMVQTNTVQGPGGEAGVMRIKGTQRGLAMALAGNGRWTYLDPKLGAMHAVAEAARKVACTGATPVAATNCLNFGNPEKPEIMAQLSAAIDGIAEACNALGTPVTGGNVSLYNETKGEGIYPTPVLGVVGIIDDVTKAVPSGFQRVGDRVIIARFNKQDEFWRNEFGSSEFAKDVLGSLYGRPPLIDLESAAYCNQLLKDLADEKLVSSVSDIGSGGVAVALARASFTNHVGVEAWLHSDGGDESAAEALFFEDSGSVLISCAPENADTVIKRIEQNSSHYVALPVGETVPETVEIRWEREVVIREKISDLVKPWATSMEDQLAGEVVTA